MSLSTPGDCNCICHMEHFDQHAALNMLGNIAITVMLRIPPGVNGLPFVLCVDEMLDSLTVGHTPVLSPRTCRVMMRMWQDVIFPARCRFRDQYRVQRRAMWGEDSMERAEEESAYLEEIQDGLRPLCADLYAIAVDHGPVPAAEWKIWSERVALARDYLTVCQGKEPRQATVADSLLQSLEITP